MATEVNKLSLYNGDVEVLFYPNSHRYKVDGLRVKSVSGVLGVLDKPWIEHWIVKEIKLKLESMVDNGEMLMKENLHEIYKAHRAVSDRALDVGSQVHKFVEDYILTESKDEIAMPDDDNVANGAIAFLNRVRNNEVEFHASEQIVYSRTHRYVGTFDAIATVNGKKYLIDFKTSKGFYPFDHGLQLAAYKSAYEEEHGEGELDGMILLHLDKKNGEFGAYDMTLGYESLRDFFHTLSYVNYQKSMLEKSCKKFTNHKIK